MSVKNSFWMSAKYDGECSECESIIAAGDRIVFDKDTRKVYCNSCGEDMIGEDQ